MALAHSSGRTAPSPSTSACRKTYLTWASGRSGMAACSSSARSAVALAATLQGPERCAAACCMLLTPSAEVKKAADCATASTTQRWRPGLAASKGSPKAG